MKKHHTTVQNLRPVFNSFLSKYNMHQSFAHNLLQFHTNQKFAKKFERLTTNLGIASGEIIHSYNCQQYSFQPILPFNFLFIRLIKIKKKNLFLEFEIFTWS